ncbi:ATP-binding protein [Mucilaginibacter sp. McL0603]|uniref:sensor histidine kinase n=1 Tax=Mucilaginibacter sp. McL0603 TaxID=3415670 RepID=UPI003CE8B9D5
MKVLTFTNKNMDSKPTKVSCKRISEREQIKDYYGNWKLCLETNALTLNSAARNLLGLRQDGNYDMRQLLRLIDLKCFERAKTWLRMLRSGGVLEPVHLKIYTPGIEPIWIRLSGFHYADQQRSPGLILGCIEDHTQYVNEERITLAIVNHEIRTPLSVMKLSAQMIQLPGKDESKVSHADLARNIERHVDGITTLLDQYLSNSGDDGRFQRLNLSVFDLNHLVRQVFNDLTMIHCHNKFINKTSVQAVVKADKYLVMQVVINYLTNAVKYSPKYSEITVDLCVGERDIVVGIADQGEGIPAGLENRIFDQFFRTGMYKDTAGRGLGLYLVKQIIERHKGSVWMKSGKEKGSVFFFSLPFHRCESETM